MFRALLTAISCLTAAIESSTEQRKREFEYARHQDTLLLASLLMRATLLARRIKVVARAFKRLDNSTP